MTSLRLIALNIIHILTSANFAFLAQIPPPNPACYTQLPAQLFQVDSNRNLKINTSKNLVTLDPSPDSKPSSLPAFTISMTDGSTSRDAQNKNLSRILNSLSLISHILQKNKLSATSRRGRIQSRVTTPTLLLWSQPRAPAAWIGAEPVSLLLSLTPQPPAPRPPAPMNNSANRVAGVIIFKI